MSSRGELYINEDCADTFRKELDEWFGEDNWRLDVNDYAGYYDISQLPITINVKVLDDDTDEEIGEVEIENNFYVENEGYGAYVEVEPKSIKLISVKDKLKNMILKKVNENEQK